MELNRFLKIKDEMKILSLENESIENNNTKSIQDEIDKIQEKIHSNLGVYYFQEHISPIYSNFSKNNLRYKTAYIYLLKRLKRKIEKILNN